MQRSKDQFCVFINSVIKNYDFLAKTQWKNFSSLFAIGQLMFKLSGIFDKDLRIFFTSYFFLNAWQSVSDFNFSVNVWYGDTDTFSWTFGNRQATLIFCKCLVWGWGHFFVNAWQSVGDFNFFVNVWYGDADTFSWTLGNRQATLIFL